MVSVGSGVVGAGALKIGVTGIVTGDRTTRDLDIDEESEFGYHDDPPASV